MISCGIPSFVPYFSSSSLLIIGMTTAGETAPQNRSEKKTLRVRQIKEQWGEQAHGYHLDGGGEERHQDGGPADFSKILHIKGEPCLQQNDDQGYFLDVGGNAHKPIIQYAEGGA